MITPCPRAGSALGVVVTVLAAVLLALALGMRAALAARQGSVAGWRAAQAREAAAAALVVASTGGPTSGTLAGGATWFWWIDSLPGGERVLWATGRAISSGATLSAAGLAPSADSSGTALPPRWIRPWLEPRW